MSNARLIPSFLRLAALGAAALLVTAALPGRAAAQGHCSGTPILGNESAGSLLASSDEAWGIGGTGRYGTMELLIGDGWSRTRIGLTTSFTGDTGFGICPAFDWVNVQVGDFKTNNFWFGMGAAWGTESFAAFATPFLGFANDDLAFKLNTGGAFRLGRLLLGLDATMPLMVEYDVEPLYTLRFGWIFGSRGTETAAPPPARPTTTTTTTPTQPTPRPAAPTPAPAQPTQPAAGTRPYALDDIEAMVRNDVSTARILDLARRSCVSFRMNDAAETRLRRVGADPELLNGLRQVCFSAQ